MRLLVRSQARWISNGRRKMAARAWMRAAEDKFYIFSVKIE